MPSVLAVGVIALCVACTQEGPQPTPEPTTSATEEPEQGPGPALFAEEWRPQFHYSPTEGRLADPNGLVWYEDEWHLFHQQMGTWAHAVSPDLVHWEQLPTALEHDELGQAMSGSAVVDHANTSGLFDGEPGGLVAVYTSTAGGEAQSLAYSSDRGRTWQRYEDNPVLPGDGGGDFRDPKVFWHEPTQSWVMVVAEGDTIGLYGSPNLLDWHFLSDFGAGQGLHSAVWECPDLFPLPLDGDPGEPRWVLAVSVGASDETGGSTAQYFVGDFDGTTFVRDPDTPADLVQTIDAGQDFYAVQSFENAPDGRRIWLAWMGNWAYPYDAPTAPWTNAMSLPRELSLHSAPEGYRLVQAPVDELAGLREDPLALTDVPLEADLPLDLHSTTFEFTAEIAWGEATEVGVRAHEARAEDGSIAEAVFTGVDRDSGQFFLDRTEGGRRTLDGDDGEVPFAVRRSAPYEATDVVLLHGYVDESSIEVFVDDGSLSGTLLSFPGPGADGVSLYSVGGTAEVRSLEVYPLRSVWADAAGE